MDKVTGQIGDDTPVEFILSHRQDGKLISVTVMCEEPMDEEAFSNCLFALAKDLEEGELKFNDGSSDISAQ